MGYGKLPLLKWWQMPIVVIAYGGAVMIFAFGLAIFAGIIK